MTTPVAEPVRPSLPASPPPAQTTSGRAHYTSVAAAGLLLMAAVPAFMLVLGAISGMPIGFDDLSFFGPNILVPAVAAALVWRFGLWAKVVGIVAALAGAFLMFWIVFGVEFVGSLGDFVPGVAYPLGILMAVGGSIAAIVASRRGRRSSTMIRPEKRILAAAGAIVALAVVASVITGFVQREAAADADVELTATMADFEFDESVYEVSPGETIRVHNADAFAHTFTVPELGIDQRVLPGEHAVVEIPADAEPGTYTVYCEPHSDMTEADPEDAGMASTMIVR